MQSAFTSEQLEELKKQLTEKKRKIEKEIEALKSEDPFSDEQRLIENEDAEDALEEVGHENIVAQINLLQKNLSDIEQALSDIEKGTYGICKMCKKRINFDRLKIAPTSHYCIECQEKIG